MPPGIAGRRPQCAQPGDRPKGVRRGAPAL